MKKLHKDLTTPEQKKRLLELGVPKVTANYYYDSRDFKPQAHEVRGHWNEEDDYAARRGYKITPLWSVGRLIEIGLKCSTLEQRHVRFCGCDEDEYSLIDYVINVLESGIMTNHIDFSKLEE